MKRTAAVAFVALALAPCAPLSAEGGGPAAGHLAIYHWFDYMPQELLAKFSAETGIEVTMDTPTTTPSASRGVPPRRCGAPPRAPVEQGRVWLTNGPTSVWNEPVPYGALDEAAVLHPPPALIPAQELTAHALPDEWRGIDPLIATAAFGDATVKAAG